MSEWVRDRQQAASRRTTGFCGSLPRQGAVERRVKVASFGGRTSRVTDGSDGLMPWMSDSVLQAKARLTRLGGKGGSRNGLERWERIATAEDAQMPSPKRGSATRSLSDAVECDCLEQRKGLDVIAEEERLNVKWKGDGAARRSQIGYVAGDAWLDGGREEDDARVRRQRRKPTPPDPNRRSPVPPHPPGEETWSGSADTRC